MMKSTHQERNHNHTPNTDDAENKSTNHKYFISGSLSIIKTIQIQNKK